MVFPTGFLPAQAALNGIGIALADRSLVEGELQIRPPPIAPIAAPPLVRGTAWYFVHPQGRAIDEPI